MKITASEIEHVAHLARLHLSEEEIRNYSTQLNDILAYVDELQGVDTSGVESTTHALQLVNAFREDRVVESLGVEKSLENGPETEDGAFTVPRII